MHIIGGKAEEVRKIRKFDKMVGVGLLTNGCFRLISDTLLFFG